MEEPASSRLPEIVRLNEDSARTNNWKRWGPYLAERQWGTVREDYSADGSCWTYFPHDEARWRAYRWGEDGLLGWCDRECRLCFAVALWNGKDPILKERFFGLSNPQGNHGEDVKELYYYLESSPTHSWARALYKYPQAAYPYQQLIDENARRNRDEREYEITDTGVFKDGRYFDVQTDYAKASPNDLLIRITITNNGPDAAPLHVLPSVFFCNTWAWGKQEGEGCNQKPVMTALGPDSVAATHETLGRFIFSARSDASFERLMFTENDTNIAKFQNRLRQPNEWFKDGFHDFVVRGQADAINPANTGTKAAAHYVFDIAAHATVTIDLRLHSDKETPAELFGQSFEDTLALRRQEYQDHLTHVLGNKDPERRLVAGQAFAGLLWSRQYYHYVVREWLKGDPTQPPPPPEREDHARNRDWKWHLFNRDIISMPDKWEYPWYASWDLAFHMIPMARVDPQFAKEQLLLLLREWYMHPSGQIPAYEFNFSDVNPPVHAWACWRVYKMTGPKGKRDRGFLERAFQKLMLNFTWWVNRKDESGKGLFGGGFLGLDNIGLFDRSQPLPIGGRLEQADGTAWMAFFCGTMLFMALELASADSVYEDIASKFFEHYVAIVDAINRVGGTGLWDEEDGFYYDQIFFQGDAKRMKIRSLVGIIPLFANGILDPKIIDKLPGFKKRLEWFVNNRPGLRKYLTVRDGRTMLSIVEEKRLVRVLNYVLNESEFLSPYGVRSLSKIHSTPYVFASDGHQWSIRYEPAESRTGAFGGNSNWRGPVWFPLNFLLIESLERYHYFYGDSVTVECPVGSGNKQLLRQVASELRRRMIDLFLPGPDGNRPCFGASALEGDPHAKELVHFHEYFCGDSGRGLGASHQTGWTALVAEMIR